MGISSSKGIFSSFEKSNSFSLKKPKSDYMSISFGWVHHFKKVYFAIGLYSFMDPPQYQIVKESSFPVGLYLNFCWVIKTKKADNK